jgi:hypothetical protein
MKQADAAKDAASVQAQAAARAAKIQWKMFKTTRRGLAPFAKTGKQALGSLARLYGLRGEGGYRKGIEQFYKGPDYQVALREGVKAIDSSAAARGGLLSGANLKAVTNYGSDLASQKFGAYIDRLQHLAGLGENAAAGTGNAALSTGRGVGSSFLDIGEAQASGIVGSGNAMATGISDFGNNLGKIFGSFQTSAY